MYFKTASIQAFLVVSITICAILVPVHEVKATALSIGDSNELGSLWPGVQKKTDNRDKATYVNHMLGMALGAVEVSHGQVYFRSDNRFKYLPTAESAVSGTGRTIRVRTGGLYTYLFATYEGHGSEIWYVGNFRGVITIPFLAAGHHLTGWTLFGPSGTGVPDGGVTVMLLGVAIGVLALARRFLIR